MKRMLVAVLLGTIPALSACTAVLIPPYSAEAIEASIIDADTQQPLEGVIVVANWELRGGGLAFGGSTSVGQLKVMEAVSSQDGRFFFPAWGPIKQFKGELHNNDPQLIFFKAGYEYRALKNDYQGNPPALVIRHRSQWNGKTIEMRKFTGTVEEYAKHVERLYYSLDHIATDQPEDCNWKKLPRTIVALAEERKALVGQGINPHTIPSLDNRLLTNDEYFTRKGGRSCGSPKAFLRSIVP